MSMHHTRAIERLEARRLLSIDLSGVGNWSAAGPNGINNGQNNANYDSSGLSDPVSGAVEALAPNPVDKNILYIGAVNGGVWRTFDAYNPHGPSWTPLTDAYPSLSVGALTFSPLDSGYNTLFAGSGATSNGGINGNLKGILRTTDGGDTWVPMGTQLVAKNIQSLVATPLGGDLDHEVVLAACSGASGGVFRSTDGGQNFTQILAGLPSNSGATYLIADPANTNRYYAALPGKGVFRSDDGGMTWADVSAGGLNGVAGSQRIELALYNDSSSNVVYAAIVGSNGFLSGVFKSENQGGSWSELGDPNSPDVHSLGQGGINLSITVNPTQKDDVFVGGDANGFNSFGDIQEWDGDEWDEITGLFDAPHSDSRDMVFDAAGNLVESDDGGVYRHVDGDWKPVIGDLGVTELYSAQYDALNNIAFGGAQDNARPEQEPGGRIWNEWSTGDGANTDVNYFHFDGFILEGPTPVHLDSDVSVRWSMGNNFHDGGLVHRLFAPSISGPLSPFSGQSDLDGLDSKDDNFSEFTNFPIAANRFNPFAIAVGGHSVYTSSDFGDNVSIVPGLAGDSASDVFNTTALVYGGMYNGVQYPELLYAGYKGGLSLRVDPGEHALPTNYTGGSVRDIVLDPDDWHRVYVTDGSKIYFSADAGDTWQQVGGLAGVTSNIRTLELYNPSSAPGDETLLAGANDGVFVTADPLDPAPQWKLLGAGLPHAPVTDLHYIPQNDTLIAATFGRGAWIFGNTTARLTSSATVTVNGDDGGVAHDDSFLIITDPKIPGMIDIIENGGTPSVIPLDSIDKIQVNGLDGNDTLTVDFANGNPVPTGGINYDGGALADSLVLKNGSFTNETNTATGPGSGAITLDGSTVNYSNLAPIDDTVSAVNYTFNAPATDDAINITNGAVVSGVQTDQISSGNGTFELVNFGNKTNVSINGQKGADTFTMSATTRPDGLLALALNGQSDTNAGDDNAGDTFTISSTIAGVPLNLTGGGGDDVFNATLSPNATISVDGGGHVTGDTLHLDGDASETTINSASFTRVSFQPVNFANVELLRLTNGPFGVPGALAPGVQVDQDAKLFGTGTVSGAVSAVSNGIISPGITQGSATGTLGSGNVSFASTSTYQVQVNGLSNGTCHDVLNVTGTVNLGGATLDASVGITAVPGDEFMIIDNDGSDPVVGKFAQGDLVTIGSQKFAIDYAYDGDGDGNFNDVALIRYGAALAPDPCDPTKQALFVSATTGNDDIRFVSVHGNKTIQVLINGMSEGIFQPTGLLIGFGQAGDDTISVNVSSRQAWLFGQAGNDQLAAGNNDAILLGGVGNDTATAGNGHDILVGGKGQDLLKGGNGDDLLIGGSLAFETNTPANRASLCAIFDEWTGGTGGWKGKADHLMNGGGLNGSVVLNSTTVFDDAAADVMQGSGGQDWFLAHTTGNGPLDLITDKGKDEILTNI